ncbi:myopalladin isoform X1 [Scyliorhinus canicula]|uniref:myopalladin isoform X1 n=2 Tax=Scyliorhinus canicula TaxID=7830 RepID=UPI0018F28F54|nr:myopalladin isoform X1 [Scyliorhinus canicula]XP_038678127.1 myopalladin isoform X1 [Scyliorhinus canicula]XP_038678128.1 myopalladin isoform X1 [Scyliorhinus canicula]
MQEDNFEASTSISQLLRESYLAEVRIHQDHCQKSRSEGTSQHIYYVSKTGVPQDLDGQDESPDLSAFLSQEELDKSVNLAQQAIAQCSHEVKKDEKQINVGCPTKDLSNTLKPAGNRNVLDPARSSGSPEQLNNQSYHCENLTRSPSNLKETHREFRKQSKNSPYSTETDAKKDYLTKAADFIEELSSLFKTTSTKRVKPRTCKNSRSRVQTKSHSQAQYSSWSVDERERTHVPLSAQDYEETIPKEESEEIAQAPVLSAGTETLTAEAKTTEVQSTEVHTEGSEGDPPRFIQRLKSREAAEGSRVQLECVVTGLPTPDVRWYCEGKELKNSHDIEIGCDGNNYSLTISEAFVEDTGRYTCLASNIYGSDTTSAELYIEGLSSSESEHDSEKEDMTQVQEKINITATAPSPSNPTTVHTEFQQLHSTVDSPPVRPIHQIQSPTNLLQGLDGLPLMAAPVFTKPLQDVTVKEGQLVVLECRIKGIPFPKMEWYREETLIEDSPDFRILQKKPRSMSDSEEICTLVIAEAFSEDSGMFTCTASNKYGTMSSTSQLTVYGTEDSNAVSMNASSSVAVEATGAKVQPNKTLLRPTAHLKPKLEGVLVNHHEHKPKARLRVHFKLPEDDTGNEPSFEREHGTTNGQNTWASGLISPTKEPPPVSVKPKLDPVQLQQLHNQVLLEQQQEAIQQQSPFQSSTLSSSLPTAFNSTMNVLNSATPPSVQPTSSSRSPTPNTLPQAFNYARPKQFIATPNVMPTAVRSYSPSPSPLPTLNARSDKTEKQYDDGNYFGFPLTPAFQDPFIYPSRSLPSLLPRSPSTTSAVGQATSSPVPPLPSSQSRIVSPTFINAANTCQSPVQNPVAFLSSVLPSLPSAPSTNAMGLPKSAPAIPPQGTLKKVFKSPQTFTDDEIRENKDSVIYDLDRKLRFKEEVFHTGQQDFKYLIESTRNSLGQQQEYKVSNFEQRLLNEIEFRLERTPVEESDDEVEHEDIPTGKCIAPIFDKKLKHLRVVEGSPVTMSCKLMGIPVPKVYWFKDGKQISKKNEHFKMKRDGDGACSLYIESSTNDDDGNYTVMAVNPQGRNSSSGHLMVQNIPIRGRIVPSVQSHRTRSRVSEGEEPVQERFFCPHFLQAPGDMIAHEGQICRLDCKVSGLPNPDLFWLLNGKPILPDVSHKILVRENGIHSLLIDHLTAGDAGTYTCIATNKAGQSSFSLELSVVAKEITKAPVFIEKLRNTGVPEGHPVRIECRVVGMPPPIIFWKKDNETISPNRDRISLHQDTTGYVCLLIQPTKKNDAGWYTVSAKNEAGIVSCTARLDLYAQWHQQITQPIKKVRPSTSRYAALTSQGLDFKSAFPSVDNSQFQARHEVMESDEL